MATKTEPVEEVEKGEDMVTIPRSELERYKRIEATLPHLKKIVDGLEQRTANLMQSRMEESPK